MLSDAFPTGFYAAANCNIEPGEVDDLLDTLMEMTDGLGPDACIDALGFEATETGSPRCTTR